MNDEPGTAQYLATVPLTAPGGEVTCDLLTTAGTPCPSRATGLGSDLSQIRAAVATRGWRTIARDGDILDVCPHHPDEE